MNEPGRPGAAAAATPAACGGRCAGQGGDVLPRAADLLDPAMITIVRALADRARYRYVLPRVQRAGPGWLVVSRNCSRHVDPEGGEIPIAWFEPAAAGWNLYARNHRRGQWLLQAQGLALAEAASRVSRDPLGIYWP